MSRAFYDMLLIATAAHHGQMRKGLPDPYVLHCLRVARDAAALGMDEDCQVAALGHDILEDTNYDHVELERQISPRAYALIKLLTKWWGDEDAEAHARYKSAYYAAILKNPFAVWLKIIDRTDNLRDMARMVSARGCPVSLKKWAVRYNIKTEAEFAPLIASAVVDIMADYDDTPVPAYIQALTTAKAAVGQS